MSEIDQIWVLFCAILVFGMQIGFMCIEAGITRSKNNVSVAIKNITDFSIAFLAFWLVGRTLMYGESVGGLIGAGPVPAGQGGEIALLFQAMFCGTAATILSGAVAERCSFFAYAIATVITALVIYPVFGHWVWATDAAGAPVGWLAELGFRDFAGSGVVHGVGGAVALAAILVIGPREGRFLQDGQARRFNGSDLPMTMLGVLLLWLGWLGFNGGSALAFGDAVPGILLNTLVAGAAGTLAGLAASWWQQGKPNVFIAMNAALGGLVAVTAGCHVLAPWAALVVGAVGGVLVCFGDRALERLRIDDAVGAVPVHLFNGIWGLVALGLFGAPALDTGLGTAGQTAIQLGGALVMVAYAFGGSLVLLSALNRVVPMRVSQHVETIGLNVGEHGANTDLNELLDVMQRQARDRDLSIRAPQSPFTEVGQIGLFYNSVMYELERAFSRMQRQSDALEASVTQYKRLLESVLPQAIAERMNSGEAQIVDQVADATVVFVDIVDFTAFSMEVPPERSMEVLQTLFGAYDEVIRTYGLEKIKTVGDCYMFVAGLNQGDADHCATAVDAAIELLFATRQAGIALGHDMKVRIGVHSGPLIAGVVGELRFVYDLWGSTVNLANRIEEAGAPGKITVSRAVIDRIEDQFVYQRAGRIRLRGVGPTVLYAVEGRRTGAVPRRTRAAQA